MGGTEIESERERDGHTRCYDFINVGFDDKAALDDFTEDGVYLLAKRKRRVV